MLEAPMSDTVEKTDGEKPKAPPTLTPQQKRMLRFYQGVFFTKGAFHALFTFGVYAAWAEVVSHLLPPTTPHELFACLVLVVMAFVGWVSGIDIISDLLEPWNLAEHPRVKNALSGESDKSEHKKA
jgi:hypothetical protein